MDSRDKVRLGLKANTQGYGKPYCPCVPSYLYSAPNAEDYVCPCKKYREEGECACGLFESKESS